jgi:chemotaxis protein histidine kinase CheA
VTSRRPRPPAASKAHAEFVSEAEEILERMRDDLSGLAEGVDAGAEPEPETVNGLFRSAHSL